MCDSIVDFPVGTAVDILVVESVDCSSVNCSGGYTIERNVCGLQVQDVGGGTLP